MKRFLSLPFSKDKTGKSIRIAIIAGMLVYVLMMTFLLPNFEALPDIKGDQSCAAAQEEVQGEALNVEGETNAEGYDVFDSTEDDKLSQAIKNALATEDDSLACSEAATIIAEDKSKRDIYSKHYLMSDGSYKLIQYSDPIHFKTEGSYEEIDNSLLAKSVDGKDVYENAANNFKVSFSDESSAKAVGIQIENYKLKWQITSNNSKAIRKDASTKVSNSKNESQQIGSIKHTGIFNDVDFEYIVSGSQLKENIIVNKRQDNYIYTFNIEVENLVLTLKEGSIIGYDANSKKEVLTIPQAFMYDSNYEFSEDIKYQLAETAKGYTN
jgi:hypothetical protein